MWLYIPSTPSSTSSPSAPEGAGSISASSWQFQALAQSAWWRGKPSPSRIWFRRWNKVSWLRVLCGRMPEPSTAAHGVVSWMASLAASRASRTAWPGASEAASTSATCGARPGASSRRPGRGSSSSKMSPACSRRGMMKSLEPRGYGETYADWVSRLRADCSARQRSARRTSASGCSSSQWPTATANMVTGPNQRDSAGNPALPSQAAQWATPCARDCMPPHSPEYVAAKKAQGHGMKILPDQVARWPTPTANDYKGSGPTLERSDGKMRGDRLDYAVEQLWSTPRSSDGEKGGPNQAFGAGGMPLPAQTVQWMTPSVADVQGGRMTRSKERSDELPPNGQSDSVSSLLAHPTSTDGAVPSTERRTLNPLFVEWLMGWPRGWTSLGLTPPASNVCACSATALSLYRQRMRSELSRLGLPPAEAPAQLALFA